MLNQGQACQTSRGENFNNHHFGKKYKVHVLICLFIYLLVIGTVGLFILKFNTGDARYCSARILIRVDMGSGDKNGKLMLC